MRKFVIIAYLFFNTVVTFGQIANDNDAFFNYTYDKDIIKRNKVESLTITTTSAHGKNSSKIIYYFNKEGLLTNGQSIDEKGNLNSEYYFTTNKHNDLVSRIQKDHEHNRTDTALYFKAYEGDHLIKDSSSETGISCNYEYNLNGKLYKTIVSLNFSVGNKSKRITVNLFDSLNRVVNSSETIFQNEMDLTGTLFSDRDILYDKYGKIVKEIEKLKSKNSLLGNNSSIKYVYDNRSNLIKIQRTNASSKTYTYNEKGLVTTKRLILEMLPDAFDDKKTKIKIFDKYNYTYR